VHEIDGAVARLAARQHGLVTTGQVRERGGTSSLVTRRCRAGHWQRIAPGVYRIGGAPATFSQRVMAAVLWAGPGAVASHRTAARLWGLIPGLAVPVEVTVPLGRSLRRRGLVVHRSRDLALAAPRTLDGVPVTGLARTLLDLGAVAPERVPRALTAARRQHGLAWDEILQVLVAHRRRGRSGLGPLRALVGEHYEDLMTDSTTEDEAYEILMASGAVPRPTSQVEVRCADGVAVTIDFGWPEWGALLEIFGVDHLTNEPLQHLDLHRRNQIELAGHSLLIYTGRLLRRQPDQFVHDVRTMLARRGFPLPDL
jgi:hypothetical protein